MTYLPVRIFAAFAFGIVMGCYVNTLEYRLRAEIPLMTVDCYCPKCGCVIRQIDQIPIAGWLMLGGKCRQCHEKIDIRYPLVEGGCGILFALIAAVTDTSVLLPVLIGLSLIAAYLAVSMIVRKRLPKLRKLIGGVLSILWLGALIAIGLLLVNIALL